MVISLRLESAVCAALLIAPTAALGATVTFSTSDSEFDPGVRNQGWWSDTLDNADNNQSYFVGTFQGNELRNFFTFDLTALPAGDVVSATLRLTRLDSSPSNEGTETIELFDVSTDAATLNDNSYPSPAIFADLGSGTSYGAFDVPGSGADTDVLVFALSGSALADIAAAAGGFFSIGGALRSDDGADHFFASGRGIPELTVEVIPEPATGALLLLGLLGIARPHRRAQLLRNQT